MLRFTLSALLGTLAWTEDLQNSYDVLPGLIVSGSDATKYGLLTMKTSWVPAGEGGNAELQL